MPDKVGIYFVIVNNKIVYIGKTTDFVKRLEWHKGQCLEWDTVRLIQCDEKDLDKYESRWVKRFMPPMNKMLKGRKAYVKKKKVKTRKIYMKFRKLTKKSIIGFGNYRDRIVGELIENKHHFVLIDIYFNLSHITFFDDILDDLRITSDWRIEKPGTCKEKLKEFKHAMWPELVSKTDAIYDKMIKNNALDRLKYASAVSNDKMYNRNRNQGKRTR